MKMTEWTNKKVFHLIEMYRDRPALWDNKHEHYKDKAKRQEEMRKIAAYLGESKEEIERKVKNLLSHFARELKKEGKSSKCGTISSYKSKWFAYEAMMFLKDKNKSRRTINDEDEVNSSEEDHSIDDPSQIPFTEDQTEKIDRTKTKQFTSPKEISTRKRKLENATDEDNVSTKENWKNQQDEYTLFGELVAIRLRQLPTYHAKIVVQHIINTTLFDAQMGKYNSPSDFQNNSGSFQMQNIYHPQETKIHTSIQPPSLEPYTYISQSQPATPGSVKPLSPGSYGSGSEPPTPTKIEVQSPESIDI
ncbi:uncharacterized protein LOC108908865 [Anoplophora glabripennis]|uniref:uncharacterized protein LOC108908865 n=1 Tax=Anoplophora glabripennis TaxID=217634 RepID=UPI000874B00B|nr:uncharacterized protein LOC108908865 [Anoplophora glabripennis]